MSALQRLRDFLAENARAHRECAAGWHRYIEAIHAHYFNLARAGRHGHRRQQWHEYERRRDAP